MLYFEDRENSLDYDFYLDDELEEMIEEASRIQDDQVSRLIQELHEVDIADPDNSHYYKEELRTAIEEAEK